tara:strand:+ start:10081 stop:10932 length:852 start_codon:yes stop_codon:yes gene_type:complete
MKLNKDIFLYSAEDKLVTNKKFNIYCDLKTNIAWTDIGNEKDLSKYYYSNKYDSFKKKPLLLFEHLYFFAQYLMLRYKWSIIKKLIPYKIISLDVGSGIGGFAEFCLKRGVNQSIVENNLKALKICKKKGLTTFSSINKIPTKSRFNIITFWHSLEHMINLNETLNKCYSLLDKNGFLVIAIPNINSFDSKYYKEKWAALDVPRHLWHFNRRGIEYLLNKKDFLLIRTYPLFFDVFYISYLTEKQKGSFFPLLKGILIGIISNIKALYTREYSSIIYVFKKRV